MYLGRAAVITVGTELAEGLRLDTNGPCISRELSRRSYIVDEVMSVADDVRAIAAVVRAACTSHELVVTTGGLGPTHDDVTREGVAAGLDLGLHEDAGQRERLMLRMRPGTDTRKAGEFLRQALVVEGARVIDPVCGTAPAQVVPTQKGELLVLPGPPGEMEPLLLGYLEGKGRGTSGFVDIACTGIVETRVTHLVAPIIEGMGGVGFTVLASPGDCHAILTDIGCGPDGLIRARDAVVTALGDVVYSTLGESLPEVVVHEATARHITCGTAESCTGGLVAGAITSVPGSSDMFNGGIVSYANEVKTGVLDVDPKTIAAVGVVSKQCAIEMAEGARRVLGTTYAVSTTGIAGPGGGSARKPVGTVCFGIAGPLGAKAYQRLWEGISRQAVRGHAVSFALDLIRKELLGLKAL